MRRLTMVAVTMLVACGGAHARSRTISLSALFVIMRNARVDPRRVQARLIAPRFVAPALAPRPA